MYLPSSKTDIVAINSKGVIAHTFNGEDLAHAWVRQNSHLHDGLHVERIVTTVRRITLKPPGLKLTPRSSFAEVARV